MKKLLVLVFIIAFFPLTAQQNLFTSGTIPPELSKGSNAVIRLNSLETIIEAQDKMSFKIRRVITVLNEDGDGDVGAIVGYDNYQKVKKIEAVIYDEFGEEIKKIKKNDFVDYSAVDGGTLYSDSRMLLMRYTPISYPYTVDFNVEIQTVNTAAIRTWRPINSYMVAIQKSEYTVVDKASLGLRFKEKNLKGYAVSSSNTPSSLKYELSNVKGIKPEDLSPGLMDIVPQVMVAANHFHYNGVTGKAENWNEFGSWIKNALLEGRNKVTDATKKEILTLVSGVDDPIEKAKLIYDYVQNNTRYISVQVGIGGIQPIEAMEVDQLKYGDCKGLTNYTQALLEVAGVPSFYTVVQAGANIVDFEPDFASLEQGNHIILGIPKENEMIWVDCTSQTHPFGFIGDFTDNRNVLVIKPEVSEVLKTVKYLNAQNYQKTIAKAAINNEGNIQASIEIITGGTQYDNRFQIERFPKDDIVKYYKEYLDNINNLSVENIAFQNDKEQVEFKESFDVYARDYGSFSDGNMIVQVNMFNKNSFVPSRYRSRKLPFEIQRGYEDQDEVIIRLPDNFTIEALPPTVKIDNKYGYYEISLSLQGKTLVYKRKLSLKNGLYPKEEYAAYREFRKKIARNDALKLILTPKT